jgi:hypothetical protein
MALPFYAKSIPLTNINPSTATPVSAATTSTVVFNTDTLTVADDPTSPHKVISNGDTNGSRVHIQTCPTGASAVDLSHWFTEGTVTTRPVIRVFGEIPVPSMGGSSGTGASVPGSATVIPTDHPQKIDSQHYENPHSFSGGDWIPLSDADGEYLITVGSATDVEPWKDSQGGAAGGLGASHSTSVTVFTRGCNRIMVLVATATAGPTGGLIAGNFVY